MTLLIIGFAMLISWLYLRYSPVKYHKKQIIGKYPLPQEKVIKATLTAEPEEGTANYYDWDTYIFNKRNSPTN